MRKPKERKPLKPSPFIVTVLNAVNEAHRAGTFSSPAWIAQAVFPRNHPGWSRSCKCGAYGSTRGSGLVMMMGGFLGKMKRGPNPLVDVYYSNNSPRHCLTVAGHEMLRANIHLLPKPAEEKPDAKATRPRGNRTRARQAAVR